MEEAGRGTKSAELTMAHTCWWEEVLSERVKGNPTATLQRRNGTGSGYVGGRGVRDEDEE